MNERLGPPTAPELTETDERTWAIACHLSPLLGFVGVPLGHLIGPALIWLLRKHESPFVDRHGRAALNFHLSVTLYFFGLAIAGFLPGLLLIAAGRPWAFLGVSMAGLCAASVLALIIFDFIMIFVAAVRTSDGDSFEYPLSIRFF